MKWSKPFHQAIAEKPVNPIPTDANGRSWVITRSTKPPLPSTRRYALSIRTGKVLDLQCFGGNTQRFESSTNLGKIHTGRIQAVKARAARAALACDFRI